MHQCNREVVLLQEAKHRLALSNPVIAFMRFLRYVRTDKISEKVNRQKNNFLVRVSESSPICSHMPEPLLSTLSWQAGQRGPWPLIGTNWPLTSVTRNQRRTKLRSKGADTLGHNPMAPRMHTCKEYLCMNGSFISNFLFRCSVYIMLFYAREWVSVLVSGLIFLSAVNIRLKAAGHGSSAGPRRD